MTMKWSVGALAIGALAMSAVAQAAPPTAADQQKKERLSFIPTTRVINMTIKT